MSAFVVTAVRLRCDMCNGAEFTGQVYEGTDDVRAAAKAAGWRFGKSRSVVGGRGQRHFDWCPDCPDPRRPRSIDSRPEIADGEAA